MFANGKRRLAVQCWQVGNSEIMKSPLIGLIDVIAGGLFGWISHLSEERLVYKG